MEQMVGLAAMLGFVAGVITGAVVTAAMAASKLREKDEQTANWHRLWEKANNKLHAVREWCHQGHKVQLRDKKGRLGKKEFVRVLLDKELKAAGHGSL